jgi:hypothetical protein
MLFSVVSYLIVAVHKYYLRYVGAPKIPGIVKKSHLKFLYKFETLVPFEILPLLLDAAIPAPLPTEMLSRAASKSLAALDSISVRSGAGIVAYSRRGSTSMATKVPNLYK